MTQSTRALLHRALTTASAFLTTLTLNASIALAKPGWIRWKIEAAKRAVHDAEETAEKGDRFMQDSKQFLHAAGPIDLIGRNIQQTLVICVCSLAATLILFRLNWLGETKAAFWTKNVLGYFIGVAFGLLFEFLRVTGHDEKLFGGYMGGALLLLAIGFLLHYKKWQLVIKSIRKGERQ